MQISFLLKYEFEQEFPAIKTSQLTQKFKWRQEKGSLSISIRCQLHIGCYQLYVPTEHDSFPSMLSLSKILLSDLTTIII